MLSLTQFIQANNDGSMLGRMAPLLMSFAEDMADELGELDEMAIRSYMFQIGEVISWIGHGDNERLPEGVRSFAEMIQPTPVGPEDAEFTSDTTSDTEPLPTGNALVAGMDSESGVSEIRS